MVVCALGWSMLPGWALTNSLTTALTLKDGVETGFDTGATIGLGILAFLVALAFVLKGIAVGRKRA